MSQMKKKLQWCLNKAERELQSGEKHRGIVKTLPDLNKAKAHLTKAEHYINATIYLKEGDFSDISASTAFYAMYHCLLAILAKFGYESRNQECTFAVIHTLIEDKLVNIDVELLHRIAYFHSTESIDNTSIELREQYQYGTSLSLTDNTYEDLFSLAQNILSKTKLILESKQKAEDNKK